MKRLIRIVSLIAVLGICLSLCGCGFLDDLRASRALFTEDGTIKLNNGMEYMLLPACEEMSPIFSKYDVVYAVEEEVPLLLTAISGDYLIKSDDGMFLQAFTPEGMSYYCRADIYDSVLDRIQNGFTAEAYCYSYYDENSNYGLYTLTREQADAIFQVCATQEPETLPDAAVLDYEYIADLYFCTEDKLFMQDTVDICTVNGKYYVVGYDDAVILYTVPQEMSETFAAIMAKQIESDSRFAGW